VIAVRAGRIVGGVVVHTAIDRSALVGEPHTGVGATACFRGKSWGTTSIIGGEGRVANLGVRCGIFGVIGAATTENQTANEAVWKKS
jgi:hypothetical protein